MTMDEQVKINNLLRQKGFDLRTSDNKRLEFYRDKNGERWDILILHNQVDEMELIMVRIEKNDESMPIHTAKNFAELKVYLQNNVT